MVFSAGLQTHIAVNFLKYAELGGVASKAVLLSDEVPNKVRLGFQTAPNLAFGGVCKFDQCKSQHVLDESDQGSLSYPCRFASAQFGKILEEQVL